MLRLPDGVFWYGKPDLGSCLYVRPCYRELYDILATLGMAVLLGTPGIGKSTAVLYFIWRLLREDAERKPAVIIYRPQQIGDTFFVFRDGRVFCSDAAGLKHQPNNPSVLQIIDGVTPQEVQTVRRTWLISSPRKTVWGPWKTQTGAPIFYMPTFGLGELVRCGSVAFKHISQEQVELLFDRWGGSARSALMMASTDEQRALLEAANSAACNADLYKDMYAVAASDGGGNKYGAGPHALFHLAVRPPNYRACTVVFASDYCRDLVLSSLEKSGMGQVSMFLSSAESSPSLGSLRGHLFERLALATLFSSARNLPMIRLDGVGTEVTEQFTPRNLFVFDTVDELLSEWRSNPSAVGRPHSSTWPTWDAVSRDADGNVTFWQITVSKPHDHGMKSVGLLGAKTLVPEGKAARFIYVVFDSSDGSTAYAGSILPVPISGPSNLPLWAVEMPQFLLPLKFGRLAVEQAAAAARNEVAIMDAAVGGPAPSADTAQGRKRYRRQ